MPLQSSKVAPGIDITADQFNKLREDLLVNHDHGADMGGTVDHGDLKETESMSGMDHMHEDINVHLNGGGPGPTDIDNPGGSMGVHGLHPSVYVPGVLKAQYTFQVGVDNSPGGTGTITFPTVFASIVGVIVSFSGSGNPMDQGVSTNTHTATNFKYTTGGTGISAIYWMAWGTM